MEFVSPLSIYIVWHPKYELGLEIGRGLFSDLCRDQDNPFEVRIGIPVYFRSTVSDSGQPKHIDFIKATRNVVLCLVDDEMLLDKAFKEYVIGVYANCASDPNNRFVPVALSKSAFKLDAEVGKLNYIKAVLPKEKESCSSNEPSELSVIKHNLLHELCKLYVSAASEGNEIIPVKLFVSHSKHDDSLAYATMFRDFVNSSTQLKTFFDANDIGFGADFARVIEDNAGKCVVVAFVSDTYASRAWCRREVITAKSNHCPIVVVNAIASGERRSFPYLGNVPTIRWDGSCASIVDLALEVTLGNFFTKEVLTKQAELFGLKHNFVLASYPELFSIVGIKQILKKDNLQAGVVLYPDPPLGNEELRLLNDMDDRITFITPLQLSALI